MLGSSRPLPAGRSSASLAVSSSRLSSSLPFFGVMGGNGVQDLSPPPRHRCPQLSQCHLTERRCLLPSCTVHGHHPLARFCRKREK